MSSNRRSGIKEECRMIQELTGFFRTSTDSYWILLRKLLDERGIDPNNSLLVVSSEDNVNFRFGILVTHGRRVIQFGVQCSDSSCKEGEMTKWEELTGIWSPLRYGHEISTALSVLEKMELTADQVSTVIESELGKVKDPQALELIRKWRVPLRCEMRSWDSIEADATYPCWIFAEHPDSNTMFAYCEHGFGPGCSWVLLGFSRPYSNMGMDSTWFDSFEDLFRDSMAWPDEEQKR